MLQRLERVLAEIRQATVPDWGIDAATTALRTYGYNAGVIRNTLGVPTLIAAGTLLLPASATSYIERDVDGVVSSNVVGWSGGSFPMAIVTTNATRIITYQDMRILAGDLLRVVSELATFLAGIDVTGDSRFRDDLRVDGLIDAWGNIVMMGTAKLVGDVTGKADTAALLHTARSIAGTSFNGSANIDINIANLTGAALNAAVLLAGRGNATISLSAPDTPVAGSRCLLVPN